MTLLKTLVIVSLSWLPGQVSAETYLLMAEEKGCYWCAQWNEDIAAIYPKTPEGQAVPLRRYDLHGDSPDVDFDRKVRFTPTFILVKDGSELGRIEGYPGENLFWGMLGMLLKDAKITLDNTG